MPFDPNAPVQLLDAPAVAAGPKAFDPSDAVDPDVPPQPKTQKASTFDPAAPVEPEHPYVTKILQNPDLDPDEKQSRIDSFNQGLAKFDPDEPVSTGERFLIHTKQAIGETLPALAVKSAQDFMNQPFQGVPLPLRLAQGQLADLQREKDRRSGALGDVMGDPTVAEYPDATLDAEISKAQGRVQKFMTPENVAAMRTAQTGIADVAAKKAGEEQSYENLPPAKGFAQMGAAITGELAGGLTDPTNLLPIGDVDKTATLASRLLSTGKVLAGQTAGLEPIRQTLATGANEPGQTGLVPAAERVAGAFVGGVILQGGSEVLGKVIDAFKGLKASDVAGKTADEAVPIIAQKTGQDPVTVQGQLKQLLPAAEAPVKVSTSTAGPGVTEPAPTASLGLNPEDRTVTFDPETPVEPHGAATPEATPHDFFDASGPVSDKELVTMHPDAPIEPVDIGPRNPTISTGTGVETPAETQMISDWKAQIAKEQGALKSDVMQTAPQTGTEGSNVVQSAPQTPAVPQRGIIVGSPLEAWADKVLTESASGARASANPIDIGVAGIVKGAAFLERGITDFGKWSEEMVNRFGEDIRPKLEGIFRASKAVYEEGPRAGDATPGDIADFTADFRNGDHQRMLEAADKNPSPATRTNGGMSAVLRESAPEIKGLMKKLAGESAPRTSALAEESGNALVRYASAAQAGPEIARAHAGVVLGEHLHDDEFANKLGGTLVEDRLQGIKAGLIKQAAEAAKAGDRASFETYLQHAQNVTSIVGKEDSPFKTPAEYEAALKDPEIQAAIQRHKEIVQPIATQQHVELGGRIAQPGIDTKAFVNLEPKNSEGESLSGPTGTGTRKGDLTAPFKKGSAFNKQAYGTADNYETDYNQIAHRMITGNFEETAKRQMYDQLSKDGLAVILPPGEKPPEINGRVPRKIQIERRGLPSASGARTLIRNMYVDPRVYPEIVRAMNVDETFKGSALSHLSNVFNWMQLKGPVNATFHIANVLSSIAGSQGGKSVVSDLVRKLPGVNVVDALAKITSRAAEVVRDSAEVRQEIGKLAQMGAGRAPWEGAGMTGRLVQLVDRAARLVRSDMYDNMVSRGWAKDSEAGKREFVNQIGQYNSRLMGQISAKLKEWGVSPFVVAGQSFNRQALRRVTMSSGISPASTLANVGMRAVEMGSLAATLFAVPMAINYALTGRPMGRPGTPMGAIDTGKTTANGKAITVDPQQWTGLRRGLRITGANAVISGVQKGQGMGQIADNAGRDIIGGFVHPYAGPLLNAGITAATGYNASLYRQAQPARGGESQLGQNALAAVEQLNPLVGNALQGTADQRQGSGVMTDLKNGRVGDAAESALKGAVKPLGDAVGVKESAVATPDQQMRTLAGRFTDSLGIPRDTAGIASPYTSLTSAVHSGDLGAAKDALDDLIRDKAAQVPGNLVEATKIAIAKREIAEYYAKETRAPFAGSLARERQFRATLDSDQQSTYAQAKSDRREAAATVRSLLYGH